MGRDVKAMNIKAELQAIIGSGTTRKGAIYEHQLTEYCRSCGHTHNCAICNLRKRWAQDERREWRRAQHEVAVEAVAAGDCEWDDCCRTGVCTRLTAVTP